ncbi:hypothetical protein HC891_01385 [Candidatus Gracilibacteria bacterium]|nr:hypothetical protein [Candidatus Gracilibacteria bacterium]
MQDSSSEAYLIRADYNHVKWSRLSEARRLQARTVALEMFPVPGKPLGDLAVRGVLLAHSFASDLFTKLPMNFNDRPVPERDVLVAGTYALRPLHTPVGWMTVVDADYLSPFIGLMSEGIGALWALYDVTVRKVPAGWTTSDIAPFCAVSARRPHHRRYLLVYDADKLEWLIR